MLVIDLSQNDDAFMVASMTPGFLDYKTLQIINQVPIIPTIFLIEAYGKSDTEGATIAFNGLEYFAFAKFQKTYKSSSTWLTYIFTDGFWFVCSNTFDKAAIEYYDDSHWRTLRTVYLAGGVIF